MPTDCDLGCGTGELTAVLHRQLEARETLGLDSSDAMLARSLDRRTAGLEFVKGDISTFDARTRYDLVFSNAALSSFVQEYRSRWLARTPPGGYFFTFNRILCWGRR